MHARKSQDFCEGIVKGDSSKGSERKDESVENVHLCKEYVNGHEQTVGRNVEGRGRSGEILEGSEDYVTGQ